MGEDWETPNVNRQCDACGGTDLPTRSLKKARGPGVDRVEVRYCWACYRTSNGYQLGEYGKGDRDLAQQTHVIVAALWYGPPRPKEEEPTE